jgi:glycosyltransferase involved in cell wall biosynthesis
MKILFLPHAPLRSGRTRGEHLIEGLARHHEIRVLSFRIHPVSAAWRYFADLITHSTVQGPVCAEIAVWRFPRAIWLNSLILNWIIRREMRSRNYDVFISSPIVHISGEIDFDWIRQRVAIVCDYLDGGDWSKGQDETGAERRWVKAADSVLCVSRALTDQAKALNPSSFYVPNGVELGRYRRFRAAHSTRECKISLGIDPEAFVVSIIGLTCSSSLYFIDAVLELARRGENIVLLLVGDSPLIPAMRKRAAGFEGKLLFTGQVDYQQVLPYFMASDVGLNVVDDDPYYHRQSPLKIFEYAAMGKPVVVAPWLTEVAEMNLANVVFCDADAGSLADELATLRLQGPQSIDIDLDRYDWEKIVQQVEDILVQTTRDIAARRGLSRSASVQAEREHVG